MKCFSFIFFFLVSLSSVAQASDSVGFFLKNEFNDDDYIAGVGVEAWLVNDSTHIGVSVNSSIGQAEVADTYEIQHSYFSWDLGIKFGYFNDFFIYAELGFDLGELILSGRHEDDYEDNELEFSELFGAVLLDDFYDNYDQSNDIDAYVGAGLGMKFDKLMIEGFMRYRQIDGEFWKANNQAYSGVKATITF